MFEAFLKEFLSNFKDLEIINYEEAFEKHMSSKVIKDISDTSKLFTNDIKFKGRHLIYFNAEALYKRTGIMNFSVQKNRTTGNQHTRRSATFDVARDYSKDLPIRVQYDAEVILSVNYKEKTIVVNKIKESRAIAFTRFDYMNRICTPGSKFTLPTNAEDFIMRI